MVVSHSPFTAITVTNATVLKGSGKNIYTLYERLLVDSPASATFSVYTLGINGTSWVICIVNSY